MSQRCSCPIAGLLLILTATGTLLSQPPEAPDHRPAPINQEDMSKALGGPSLVHFDLSNVAATTLFSVLAQQGHVALDQYETIDLLKTLPAQSFTFKNEPFLLALRKCCQACGFYFEFIHNSSSSATGLTLRLRKAENAVYSLEGPTLGNGLFQVFINQTHRNRLQSLRASDAASPGKGVTREELIIDFVIFADPKLLLHGMVGHWSLTDADGWNIRSVDKEGIWAERARNHAALLEWRFTATKEIKPGEAIKTVSLQLTGTGPLVATKTEKWEISKITTPASKEVTLPEGTRRYKLLSVKEPANRYPSKYGDTYHVQFSVEGVGISKGRWSNWPQVSTIDLIAPFRLLDADGNDYGLKSAYYQNNIVNAEFNSRFNRGTAKLTTGLASKIAWNLPTEIRMASMNLQFKDVAVP